MEQPRTGFGPQIKQKPSPGRDPGNPRQDAHTFGSLLQGQQQGNPARELIHPGEKVREMLMRTFLFDANEGRDMALVLNKCREFDMKEEEETFLDLLALRNSIQGRGQMEYLQGITGILSPSMLGFKGKVYDHNKHSGDGDKT